MLCQRATFPRPQKAQETQKTENRSLVRVLTALRTLQFEYLDKC